MESQMERGQVSGEISGSVSQLLYSNFFLFFSKKVDFGNEKKNEKN